MLALPACGALDELSGGARRGEGESILEIFTPMSPSEAAAWAADPFNPDKRQRGILMLAGAPFGGEPVYLRLYENSLNDEDAGVRSAAVRALSQHGLVEHAPTIARLLREDPSVLVRREAAHALQRIHNPAVVEPLIAAVNERREEDADVRAMAAIALGQYREPRVVQALIGALQDRMLRVNDAALASLTTLTGRDYGMETAEWVAWAGRTRDLFAHAQAYEYPVFQREWTMLERVVPWLNPPNEIPAEPVGASQRDAGPTLTRER